MVAERAATKSIELALVIEEGDISLMGDLAPRWSSSIFE
jgi:hypothetical protein